MRAEQIKHDIAIKVKNLEKVAQCPNEVKSNFTGLIVWPNVCQSEYPSVQWLELPEFKRNLELWANGLNSNPLLWYARMPAVPSFEEKRKMVEDAKRHLGWKCMANRCQMLIGRELLKVYFEETHPGKINNWYQSTIDKHLSNSGNISRVIRGPIIYMNNMHDNSEDNRVSLNYHKVLFKVMKEFYELYFEDDKKEMMNFEEFEKKMKNGLLELYDCCEG